jgi:hypothetical protein
VAADIRTLKKQRAPLVEALDLLEKKIAFDPEAADILKFEQIKSRIDEIDAEIDAIRYGQQRRAIPVPPSPDERPRWEQYTRGVSCRAIKDFEDPRTGRTMRSTEVAYSGPSSAPLKVRVPPPATAVSCGTGVRLAGGAIRERS